MRRLLASALGAIAVAGLFLGVGSGPTFAQGLGNVDAFLRDCPSRRVVDEIDAALPQQIVFAHDPTLGADGGCPADASHYAMSRLEKRVYQSLALMKDHLAFDAPLPWTSSPLWEWFTESVHGLYFTDQTDYSYCCDARKRIVVRIAPNSVVLSPWGDQFMDPKSDVGLHHFIGLLVHEARHANGPVHDCNDAADDQTLLEMGAWGVQRYFLAWWADHVVSPRFWAPASPADPLRYLDVIRGEGLTTCRTRLCSDTCVARPVSLAGDYDGDGRADRAIYRYATQAWQFERSSEGRGSVRWGALPDAPVPADYDGDGRTDVAMFRAASGTWRVVLSAGGTATIKWGQHGDIPVPADYDGDGRDDIAVWRPSNGTWYIRRGAGGTLVMPMARTRPSDLPVPADYDGDGKADAATFRAEKGAWVIRASSNGTTLRRELGEAGDAPVPGDYDGDGVAELAVWRPSAGTWLVTQPSGGLSWRVQWGTRGDIPVVGDFDGDGAMDKVVFRPATGTWYLLKSSGGSATFTFGRAGDTPQ